MNPCILVIDDESVIQVILQVLLANRGYLLMKCMNGKEAFKAMDEVEFNLVILDLNLPDSNGLEIADYLEINHPNTPIIFITGSYNADAITLEKDCKNRSDRKFLHKPITSAALYGSMEYLIDASILKGTTK